MNTTKLIDDTAAIRACVQLYIDGAAGDIPKLRQAFHPDARMFGHIDADRRDAPIGAFIDLVASSRTSLAGPHYRADISAIAVHGTVAVATLVEHDYAGCDFVDLFTLSKFDDGWKIVSKTFTGRAAPRS